MSIEQNKAIVQRVFDDIYNRGQLDAVEQVFAANYVDHSAPPGFPSGLDAFKQAFVMFRAPFPDLYITVEDLIAEGDKVAARLTFRGTHEGTLMGIPPTYKDLAIAGIAIDRLEDSKIVEHWVTRYDLGMMQQLGMIPAFGPPQ